LGQRYSYVGTNLGYQRAWPFPDNREVSNAAPTTAERAHPFALSMSPDTLWRVGVAGLTAIAAAFFFAVDQVLSFGVRLIYGLGQ